MGVTQSKKCTICKIVPTSSKSQTCKQCIFYQMKEPTPKNAIMPFYIIKMHTRPAKN